jgi:hypothetical protein
MKTTLPAVITLSIIITFSSCSTRRYYTNTLFEQQTAHHKVVAVLPAEMIFTGKLPKDLSPEDIGSIEERESRSFQYSLYNSILRYANNRDYYIRVNLQDINTTQSLLEKAGISLRDSWKQDDKTLAKILGVDAVVRLRIEKKRYMSDLASMGIDAGRRILSGTGAALKWLPSVSNKTNDIMASCNVVSNSLTLWNNNYKRGADHNTPSDSVIEDITDRFGRNFPYKQRNG